MPTITDKIPGVSTTGTLPVPTTLSATRAIGATTITCNSLSNWDTNKPVHFSIYQVDVNNKKVVGTQTDWKGIVSGSTITNLQLKGGTDAGDSVGAVVVAGPTAGWANEVSEVLSVAHDVDGTLKAGAVDTTAVLADSVVTNAKIASVAANKFSNPYKFRAYRTTTQTVAPATFVKVQLNTENYDTNSNFDAVTNYRYTVPLNGFYQFNGRVQTSSSSTRILASLYKNGTEEVRGSDAIGTASSGTASVLSDCIQLVAGDLIELYVFNTATDVTTDGTRSTFLSGYLVSTT